MGRTRSDKVRMVKDKLLRRIRSGYYRPGERFFSNRALSRYFDISYQTAHRLMRELVAEGWIERREFSGSYVAGSSDRLTEVTLCFSDRAERPHSFGDRITRLLTDQLDRARIPWTRRRASEGAPSPQSIPIVWESPEVLSELATTRRFAILVNERPPAGPAKSHIDSVSVDDHSGGVSAALLLLDRVSRAREVAVLQGPPRDPRNNDRVEGFLSVIPRATVFTAGSWEFEDGYQTSVQVAAHEPTAVFCTNDRLASAFIRYCHESHRELPGVIGFDNAPISEHLDSTTIAIPWEQMVQTIREIAERRLAGDTQTSIQYVLNTVPIIRGAFFYD